MPNVKPSTTPEVYRLGVNVPTDLARRAKMAAAYEDRSLLKFALRALEEAVLRVEEEQEKLRAGYVREVVDGVITWVKPTRKRAAR